MKDDPDDKAPSRKGWRFWIDFIGVIGVAATIIATCIAWRERSDRIEAEKKAAAANEQAQRADEQASKAKAEAAQAKAEADRARRSSLEWFANQYRGHIDKLRAAVSRYKEANADNKEQAKKDVIAEALAMVDLVEKWRRILEPLSKLMDGQITALSASAKAEDLDGVAQRIAILQSNTESDLTALQRALDGLVSQNTK
jgi:hypothetical protein